MQINSRKINFLEILTLILFLFLVIFSINFLGIFKKNEVEAVLSDDILENEELHINENPVNIDDIIEQNHKEDAIFEMAVEEVDLEYNTTYTENEDLPSGTFHVTQVRNRWSSRGYYNKKIFI